MPGALSRGETEVFSSTRGVDEAEGKGPRFSCPSQFGSWRVLVGQGGVTVATPRLLFVTANGWVIFTPGEGLAFVLIAFGTKVGRRSP